MPGLLRIRGTIHLEQFWPNGESDADTTKIKVTVDANSFSHAPDRINFTNTRVFDNAYAIGTGKKKLIDSQGRVTVRLQGIDAPELHFRAAALKSTAAGVTPKKRAAYNAANKPERRQFLAETATVALEKKLRNFGTTEIPCLVYSYVDHPHDVVDTYGRFVGNILIGENFDTDVNLWLAEAGWAYPTFYSSMESEEINAFLKAMKKAGKKNVWKYYSLDAGSFDESLVYRKTGAVPNAASDKGPVLMPKLFRRQVAHRMEKKAKVFSGTLEAYLKSKIDNCFTLDDFLENGVHSAVPRRFDEFIKGTKFSIKPHEIVFKEKPSKVVDDKGKTIKEF
jgi:endonuclease YncB( thermonuclease family)